jgi:hypothetical protein
VGHFSSIPLSPSSEWPAMQNSRPSLQIVDDGDTTPLPSWKRAQGLGKHAVCQRDLRSFAIHKIELSNALPCQANLESKIGDLVGNRRPSLSHAEKLFAPVVPAKSFSINSKGQYDTHVQENAELEQIFPM